MANRAEPSAAIETVTGGDKVTFYHRWCKGCELCVIFCPRASLAMGPDQHPYLANAESCTECGLCEVLCPDFAICVPNKHGRRKRG